MMKKILIGLLAVLVLLQLYRPEKNLSDDQTNSISKGYYMPANVKGIFERACNDCHTNKTAYPWYANVQPVAMWINSHVVDGKRHLNLSTFSGDKIARQNHKLEEIIEQVKEKEMPLSSYTWMGMHPEADLTDEERAAITGWAQQKMDSLKAVWPADSLVLRRRPPQQGQ